MDITLQNRAAWLRMRAVILLTLAALLLSWAPARAAVPAQSDAAAPIAGCGTVEAAALRDELNRISQTTFGGADSPVDITAIVAHQWAQLGMDGVIDAEVDRAVTQVRADADLWSKFLSGWSPAQAETLTEQVAAIAFASPGFRRAVDGLAAAVAAGAAHELAALSAESASLATVCLQQYIGTRYSDAMVAAFTHELQTQTAGLDFAPEDEVDSGVLAVIDRHKTALGGVGVIIAGQIAKRVVVEISRTVSKRVAGGIVARIVGKAGSTIIPAVGWAIGAAMIIYDVIGSLDGALPQIQDGLKAQAVKQAIQSEIAGSVTAELQLEMPRLARSIANDLYSSWLDFQRKYRQVLDLADHAPAFAALLAQADDLGKLATLVDAGLTAVGQDGLLAAMEDGSLARALDLPEASYAILAGARSFSTLLAWADLAGGRLEDVVRLEIYKHQTPEALTRDRLLALLTVDDPAALASLVLLEGPVLDRVLALSTENVRHLAAALSAEDLIWLASYLATLDQVQANRLVVYLLEDPARMAPLKDESVRAQVAAGGDVAATLRFLSTPVTLAGFGEELLRLASGEVGFGLFRAKYGWTVTLLVVGLPVLVLLALLRSLLGWLLAPLVAIGRGVRAATRRPPQPGPR